jgi:hypothetical protein
MQCFGVNMENYYEVGEAVQRSVRIVSRHCRRYRVPNNLSSCRTGSLQQAAAKTLQNWPSTPVDFSQKLEVLPRKCLTNTT